MKSMQVFKNHGFWVLLFVSISMSSQINEIIEAENAILSGNYSENSNTNASNDTFIKLEKTLPIGTLTLPVGNVTVAGIYKLEILHFNGGTTENIQISINGASNSTITLQPSNWAYQGFARSSFFDVNLVVGNNTITITSPDFDVLFDKFIITDNYSIYHVSSSTGDDSNDGSLNAPWATIEKASSISEKVSKGGLLTPGDKLLFKAGDYFEGHFVVKCSGSVAKPIELSSYGAGELPVFSGSGDISGGDYFQAISLTNSSNLLLTNLWVKNDRKDGSRYTYGEYSSFGIKLIANKWGGVMSNLVFRDLKISDVFGLVIPPKSEFNSLNATGIRMESDANEPGIEVGIKDVLVEDCYFTHIGKAGVWAIHKGATDVSDGSVNRNQNITVRNNTFYRTGGSGVILSKTYNGLIENNNFDQTGYSNNAESRLAGRGSGAWLWSSQNIIAQYNRSYGVKGPNDSYGMHIDFGNKDIIFQYNYSEESEGGFCEILGKNINSTYRFNVSVNDGIRSFHGNTIWVSDYAGTGNKITSENNYIYNNSIYLGKNYAPDITITSKNTYVYNNIFRVTNGQIGEHVDISIDQGSQLYVSNNLFQGTVNSSFSSLDVNSQSGDPLFTNEGVSNKEGYSITDGSPAIDNGKSFPQPAFPMAGTGIFSHISEYPNVDAFGVPVDIQNQTPNIGASNASNSNLGIEVNDYTNNFFNVSPNPVKDVITINTKGNVKLGDFTIYNVQGKQVYLNNFLQGSKEIRLPYSIKNGIYYLKVNAENASQTVQIVLYR